MAGHSELRHKTQATSSGNMDGSRNEDKEIDAEPVPEPPPHSPSKPQPLSVPLTIQTEDASLSLPDRPSDSSASRPDTPLVQQETNKHRRFSLLRFRNASDSQLSLRARQQAERPPPVPKRPAITTTAPTDDVAGPRKMTSFMSLASKFRRSSDSPRDSVIASRSQSRKSLRRSTTEDRSRPPFSALTNIHSLKPPTHRQHPDPTKTSGLQPSLERPSESSRSDLSAPDRPVHLDLGLTPKRSQTTTSFFKLRKAKKTSGTLFPLSHLPQKHVVLPGHGSSTSVGATSPPRPASAEYAELSSARASTCDDGAASQSLVVAGPSIQSGDPHSGQSSPTRAGLSRPRSSTLSSMGQESNEDQASPATGTLFSTGRKSFGDLFGLSRIRQNPDISRQGSLTPATPGSSASKNNSIQLPRGSIVLPERLEDESPARYLARVENVAGRGLIAAALSKCTDAFSATVLRSYMRQFIFFGDPMDMAIRKLLMEAELPKETQQIDRCLQAFANRYHECNPGIYSSPDQAYFIAFSLLILHTDVFNKNNKRKMQKTDYLKNTHGEGIYDEILECFYDNISYTPFIHVEDDLGSGLDRVATSALNKRQRLSVSAKNSTRRSAKEPIDPYTLILDGNLDTLRPNLKDAMHLDDYYNYLGTAPRLNHKELQKTFFKTGILQIVSARSRPDAFMSVRTAAHPEDAHPGIVDIRVTKVGLLWRKDTRKTKTRSPWQEWGAVLTGAQLYFFRNTGWVKNLMHQYESHLKAGNDEMPVIFKPPLEQFKPDAMMPTHGAVALHDAAYKKHKHAFVYARQAGMDEVLLAESEDERNDWLAKLNYAAAFRTSGIKMRGVVGANYDGQHRRAIRRVDGSEGTQFVQTPSGPVSITRGRIDHKMAEDIQAARWDDMRLKIAQADEKLESCQKQLEEQLRNARHLQLLAPIQGRSREQLVLAAARMDARLKWTRMEMWRERCHRDILLQDLADDQPASLAVVTPTRTQDHSSFSQRPPTRLGSRSKGHDASERSSQTPSETVSPCLAIEGTRDPETHSRQSLQTSMHLPPRQRRGSREPTHSMSDVGSTRHGSISSVAASLIPSPTPTSPSQPTMSQDGGAVVPPNKFNAEHGKVDTDERDALKQPVLWKPRPAKTPTDKAVPLTSPDISGDNGALAENERLEKAKIKRSLHRTLREGAGHLSHHRGRKDRDASSAGTQEDAKLDNILARGTGSFVVHGRKASVINLGTELQNITTEDRMLARKHQASDHGPTSPLANGEPENYYPSALGAWTESKEPASRRGSAASVSSATARSFRDLRRKYSTAQAARSVSAVGRLVVTSDGESEVAVSFSEGRKSPLQSPKLDSEDGPEAKGSGCGESEDQDREQENGGSEGSSGETVAEQDPLSSRPIQAVNA